MTTTTTDIETDTIRPLREFVTGMTALVLLIPLAVTSTKGWIRRMGNKRWNALHRLVYVSSVLGLVHYWMSVKKDITEPAVFGLVFAALLPIVNPFGGAPVFLAMTADCSAELRKALATRVAIMVGNGMGAKAGSGLSTN